MRAHNLVFSMVILSGLGALAACGVSSRGVLPRLDGGTGDMSGSCRTEGFACVKSADCCPGLTCTNTVCTNPGGGGVDLASKPRDMAMGGGVFSPILSVAWTHEFDDTAQQVNMSFAGAPQGASFTSTGAEVARDSAVVDAGAKFLVNDSFDFGLFYNGQFNADYTSNGVTATLGYRF